MSDCLFCKILAGEIPGKKVYEDEKVYAFHDINPKTPFHVLIIPKKHISMLSDMEAEDTELVGHMMYAAKKIADQENLVDAGYRVLMNCGEGGGQIIFHIHLHLMSGMNSPSP